MRTTNLETWPPQMRSKPHKRRLVAPGTPVRDPDPCKSTKINAADRVCAPTGTGPAFGDALLTLDERAVEVARLPVHCEGWAHYSQGLGDFRSRFDEAGLSERLLILLRAPW
jgi:hypothetical protein